MRAADAARLKRLPCRIERAVPLSHDVMGLFLRLPIAEDSHFQPGQYIDILLPGGRRRSFSIASPPHDARPLELHIRRVAGGEFTDRLFHEDMRASLLTIEGPLGSFAYRPHAAGTAPPMLLIGGGTGHCAAALASCATSSRTGMERAMQLYWGVRSQQDLYAQATLEQLSRRAASLTYVPVLSEAGPEWRGATGWVHEAAPEGIQDLEAGRSVCRGAARDDRRHPDVNMIRAAAPRPGCTLILSTTRRTRSSANGPAPPPSHDPPPNPPAAAAP